MKRSSHRSEQVAETIRQVVAEALARETRDPRIGRVTVTGVTVTGDLAHAQVRVLTGGDDTEKARALEGLRSAAGFLRTKVARALAARTVPELVFEIDRGAEHAARIDAILASLRDGGEV